MTIRRCSRTRSAVPPIAFDDCAGGGPPRLPSNGLGVMSDDRWAIYFTPRGDTALGRFGRAWFDDDPPRPGGANQPEPETHRRLTARPKQYGFHATLKAPFRLADPGSDTELAAAVAEIAARFQPIEMAPLSVGLVGDFLALLAAGPTAELDALAATCTTDLDRFRAPLSEADVQRRRPNALSSRQRELLRIWGYPYVFEEFCWHMTLSDRLCGQATEPLLQYLEQLYTAVCGDERAVVDSLSLVRQPAPPWGSELRG